jgi:hypothetical protein
MDLYFSTASFAEMDCLIQVDICETLSEYGGACRGAEWVELKGIPI